MDVRLLYIDGCPGWQTAGARLRQVLDASGRAHVPVTHERVETVEDARRLGFVGSPTVLVDGHDVFEAPGAEAGIACRLYRTPEGLASSPTVEQLTEALG